MDKILIIEDDVDLLNVIREYLETNKFEVIVCSDPREAVKHFTGDSGIKLVLSDLKMSHISGMDLYAQFQKSDLGAQKCPYVMMTAHLDILGAEKAYEMGVDELLAKPFELDTLLLVINYLLKKDTSFGADDQRYYPVKVDEFLHSRSYNFNVYLRLNNKYVLVTKSGQEFTHQRMMNYARKGLQYIYLNNEDFLKYTDMQFLLAQKIQTRPLDAARRVKIMNQLVGSVGRSVLFNAVDKESLGQALVSFEAFTQASLMNSHIEKLLTQYIKVSSDISERSSQMALVSLMVASNWGWSSGKVQSRIILSSLLCDIGLRDHPELLTKKRIDYTAEERKIFEQHPFASFNCLKQIADLPPEISLVALEHHENSVGLGFPQKLNRSKTHAYSKIVHCVNEFLDTLYFRDNKEDVGGALNEMYGTQSKVVSLQVLKTLFKIFNIEMPKDLSNVALPSEVLRVA